MIKTKPHKITKADKELLDAYYENSKKYDDELFVFIQYPNTRKYDYVVSSYGRIFVYGNFNECNQYEDRDGYKRVSVRMYNPRAKKYHNYSIGVHRLVAFSYLNNSNGWNMINHKDGIKHNNHLSNLEFTTPKLNTQHAISMGLQINSGPNCPSAKYPESMIRKICEMLESGYDMSEIYRELTGHKKIENQGIEALIFSIKAKKRHVTISDEYNIPEKVVSKRFKPFSDEDVKKIDEMLLEGKSRIEIIHAFGEKNSKTVGGRRIRDKIKSMIKRNPERYSDKHSTTIEKHSNVN